MPQVIDITAIQTFTDQELLIVYRYALATGGFMRSYMLNGRQFEVPDQKQTMETINWLERRINDAASSPAGGNIALSVFGDPSAVPSGGPLLPNAPQ